MQHGPLTPLGRQLRAVLANFSSAPIRHTNRHTWNGSTAIHHGTRLFSHTSVQHSQAAAAVERHESEPILSSQSRTQPRVRSQRRLKRRREVPNKSLTEALNDTGNQTAAAKYRPSKIDLSHVSPRSARPWYEYNERRKKYLDKQQHKRGRLRPLSLQKLTARYIRHDALSSGDFTFTAREQAFVKERRYTLEHVAAWARIISAKDPLTAANTLSVQLESSGPRTVPVWVLLYALRREYVSARALRLLLKCTRIILDYRMEDMPDDFTPVVFIAVMRLIRHARQVWPQAMRTLAEVMLQHLQSRQLKEGTFRNSELAKITHILNKLMSVISLSTAEHPFKNNPFQESAIVPILQYMADYRPALHINRQGYRAVIRIQLRQRKNSQEGQWAELKALSWPPWKVDRNAMDTELGPEHGISRAGATLARMHEAGYRPLFWEKLAKLFTGWDIDQTPTIQVRALLSHPGMMLSNRMNVDNEPWAARILSTRTIQEAWACYLAWEDAKLPPDQDVYLATFFKLHEEQRRQKIGTTVGENELAGEARYWPLLPGDTREMWPLPPSTHLETYTRTDPPTVGEFYRMLLDKGVVLKDRCLAFVVVDYQTKLHEGLERLQAACSVYPEIQSLISLSPPDDILKVPSAIYAATVRLYSRSTMSLLSKLESYGWSTDESDVPLTQVPGYRFNHNHPLVHALKLLHVRPEADPRLWSDVVDQITRSDHNKLFGMSDALIKDDPTSSHHFKSPRVPSGVVKRRRGAMNALRLVRHITYLRQEQHIDIDIKGFNAVCRTVERAAGVWWYLLQCAASPESSLDRSSRSLHHEAQNLARESGEYCEWLKRLFATWVGEEAQSLLARNTQAREDVDNVDGTNEETTNPREDMPTLLTVPDPATLHAYIRALGWLGDFQGLHATVEWMQKYRSELLERAERDRRGEEMTRKAVIALRVFLERSWIRDPTPALDPDDVGQFEHAEHPTEAARLLARARDPADADIITAVREIVEDVEEWGGWPSDEEVRSYINAISLYEAGEWRWTKWTAPNSGQIDVEGGANKGKIQ